MKDRKAWLMLMAGLVLIGAGAGLRSLDAPAGGWTSTACALNSCIGDTLNRLSAERAAEAKLTTWGSVTYVWYRQ